MRCGFGLEWVPGVWVFSVRQYVDVFDVRQLSKEQCVGGHVAADISHCVWCV